MPFRFRKKESITSAVRRIFREEGDKAIDELKGVSAGQPQGLHEARKRIKKLRSLVRLVRGRLGDSAAQANSLLREAAQPLSSARDAEAMIESFDALTNWAHKPALESTFATIRDRLAARRDQVQRGDAQLPAVIGAAVDCLRQVRELSQNWTVRPSNFAAIARGLGRSYRRGVEAMRHAYATPADEHFHEWRKQVKNHWYHVRLLRGLWPKAMIALGFELGILSDLLGDDHDLAVMRMVLGEERFDAGIDLGAFFQLMDDRRRVLRRSARSVGRRIFAERPGRLRKRFRAYWDAWHAEDTKLEEVLGNAAGLDAVGGADPARANNQAGPHEATDDAHADAAPAGPLVGSIHIVPGIALRNHAAST